MERLRRARHARRIWRFKALLVLGAGIAVLITVVIGVREGLKFADSFSKASQLDHDLDFVSNGRKIGDAAQEFFKATGKTVAHVGWDPKTGKLTGDLSPKIYLFWDDVTIGDLPIEKGNPKAFSLSDPSIRGGQPIYFSDEGKTTFDPWAR